MPKSFITNGRLSFVRILPPFAALGLLAGCSSVESFLPHGDPNAAAIALGANPAKTAQPGANPSEKPVVRPVASVDINCPPVDVAQDGAAYRVGGAENASVRYQFNIGDTARQCDPAGPGQASLKIGVKGEVVIGPAGSAGTYSAPLRIVITNETDKKQVFRRFSTPPFLFPRASSCSRAVFKGGCAPPHGPVDVLGPSRRHCRQWRTSGRVGCRERFSRCGVDPLPADEKLLRSLGELLHMRVNVTVLKAVPPVSCPITVPTRPLEVSPVPVSKGVRPVPLLNSC